MRRIFLSLLLCVMLAGCVSPLPTYEWKGVAAALQTMQQRGALIQTASGTATLTLRRPDGASVRVDAAFAAMPPESLRIRAWKMNQAVADWTLRPDGVWIWQAEQEEATTDEDGNPSAPAGPPAGTWSKHHSELWPMLFGIITARNGDQVLESKNAPFVIRRVVGDMVAEAVVDKNTLVVTDCRILNAEGVVVQTITLERYKAFGDALWPMRVKAEGEGGSFELSFGEVMINDELAENALEPSGRAKKVE